MSQLFIPGPVDLAPEVLESMAKPMIPHRSPEFDALFRKNEDHLKKAFMTETRVFQPPSSRSGMQEAGIRNFVQKSILSCVNGAFSERWYKVAISNGCGDLKNKTFRIAIMGETQMHHIDELLGAFDTFMKEM